MKARPSLYTGDPVHDLDVSILQDHILDPVFGIKDPKKDPRVRFIGGIRGLEALEQASEETGGVAFAMYPTSMDELLSVADAGRLMPPKGFSSTVSDGKAFCPGFSYLKYKEM